MFRIILLIGCSVVLLSGCAQKRGVCKNGDPMPDPVDCQMVYPSWARTYTGELSVNLQVSEVKLNNLKMTIASDIKKLREDYDQISNQLEMTLKASCVAFNFSPCDPAIKSQLTTQISDISTKMGFIRQNVSTMKKIIDDLPAKDISDDDKQKATKQLQDAKESTEKLLQSK